MSEEKRSGKGRRMKASIWICVVFLLAFVALFCVASYKVGSQLLTERRENQGFEKLIAQVEANREQAADADVPATAEASGDSAEESAGDSTVESTGDPASESTGDSAGGSTGDSAGESTGERRMLPAYASLYAQNPDLFGWIEIEGTKVNYPVMHTPEDPEVYLHKAFDGSYSFSGVPFMDGGCYLDCGNYIVYGHNMKNGTMFASILSYAQQDYWREHPVVRFDTLYERGTYEVVAALYSRAYSADEKGVFRYYSYRDLSDPEVFEEYVAQVRSAALYDTGLEVTYGDQLLTLSTCEYSAEDGRFVVVARKLHTTDS